MSLFWNRLLLSHIESYGNVMPKKREIKKIYNENNNDSKNPVADK